MNTLIYSLKITTRALVAMLAFVSCQQVTENVADTDEQPTTVTVVDTARKRPAPTFFVIPPDQSRARVWLCEDGVSDLFHAKHNCPVLIACKGKGTFRNVNLPRAIEEYGRYNCQTCSKDFDHIFDEDMVR